MSREKHPWGADGRPVDWPEPTVRDAIAQRDLDRCEAEWCCVACRCSGWAGQHPCSDCYGTGHTHPAERVQGEAGEVAE